MKRIKRLLKIISISLGSLIGILLLAYSVIYIISENRLAQTYSLHSMRLNIPTDTISIIKGKHIADVKGCEDCHGKDLGGKVFNSSIETGTFVGSNLTRGQGGVGGTFNNTDWVRAIKHGVNRNGTALNFMPAHEYFHLSDEDLFNLIAYVKQIPAVDNILPQTTLGPLIRTMFVLNKLPEVTPAAMIPDHDRKVSLRLEPGVSVNNGKYLTISCIGCHGDNFKGKDLGIPGIKPSVDITSTGNVGQWTEVQFTQVLRNGIRPDGTQINAKDMPWTMTANFTDDEIKSVYAFLQQLK